MRCVVCPITHVEVVIRSKRINFEKVRVDGDRDFTRVGRICVKLVGAPIGVALELHTREEGRGVRIVARREHAEKVFAGGNKRCVITNIDAAGDGVRWLRRISIGEQNAWIVENSGICIRSSIEVSFPVA